MPGAALEPGHTSQSVRRAFDIRAISRPCPAFQTRSLALSMFSGHTPCVCTAPPGQRQRTAAGVAGCGAVATAGVLAAQLWWLWHHLLRPSARQMGFAGCATGGGQEHPRPGRLPGVSGWGIAIYRRVISRLHASDSARKANPRPPQPVERGGSYYRKAPACTHCGLFGLRYVTWPDLLLPPVPRYSRAKDRPLTRTLMFGACCGLWSCSLASQQWCAFSSVSAFLLESSQ